MNKERLLQSTSFTPRDRDSFVEPQAWHRIAAASDDLECYLSFYCKPEDYMAKKYDTKALRGS